MTTKKNTSARGALKAVLDQSFGQFVKSIRESDDITQTALAKGMGVSRQFIHAVEIDKANVSIQMAMRISNSLGYPYDAFVEILLNDMLRKSGIKKVVHLERKAA